MKRNRSQAMVCRDGKLLLVEHRMKGRDFFNLPGDKGVGEGGGGDAFHGFGTYIA